ncbi:MAG TPA: lactonase family protein [Opitutus sp.]|nr:lactonase family protein [Opitutus sp.]
MHLRLSLLAFLASANLPLCAKDHVALLGTYTGESRGIYAVRLDAESGALSTPELVAELPDPEFLASRPDGRFIYALTRVTRPGGKAAGAIEAFAVDGATGKLTPLNTESTGRSSLTHLAVDPTGRMVIAPSYGGGYVASFPIKPDGSLGPCASILMQQGPLGPNHARQDSSHPHSVTISPDGRFAFVANLGLDRVFTYRLDPKDGTIAANEPAFATIKAGSGPRHTKFSADGRFFYVLSELAGTITSCRYDAARGAVEPFQAISTLPDGFAGSNTSSEIRVSPDGRFVYAANRGPNSLAVFSRDLKTGALTRIEIVPTGGDHPRNFALSPDGAWLLCAHQNTGNLTVFRVDRDTGRLTRTDHTAHVAKAVCVLFLR